MERGIAYLKMNHSLINKRLILAQSLQNNSVGALAVQFYLPLRRADNSWHALSCRIELANIQNFELVRAALDIDENRLRFAYLVNKRLCRSITWKEVKPSTHMELIPQ